MLVCCAATLHGWCSKQISSVMLVCWEPAENMMANERLSSGGFCCWQGVLFFLFLFLFILAFFFWYCMWYEIADKEWIGERWGVGLKEDPGRARAWVWNDPGWACAWNTSATAGLLPSHGMPSFMCGIVKWLVACWMSSFRCGIVRWLVVCWMPSFKCGIVRWLVACWMPSLCVRVPTAGSPPAHVTRGFVPCLLSDRAAILFPRCSHLTLAQSAFHHAVAAFRRAIFSTAGLFSFLFLVGNV